MVGRIGFFLGALLVLPGSAFAGRAEICYSNWTSASVPPTISTVFNCPVSGQKTVPQLAAERWRIQQISPISRFSGMTFEYATQIVIQEEWIFRAGFES
jgi:hypothetical protein